MRPTELVALLLLTALRTANQVHSLRWKRVGRIHWIPSHRQVEKGLGLVELHLHLVNPCDYIDDAVNIDLENKSRFGFASNATKRLIELCNQDYQADWIPKFEKFTQCHNEFLTWKQSIHRLVRRFVIWVGIAIVLLVVAISALTASYVVSSTKLNTVQDSLDVAKGKLEELNTKFKVQEEINNRTLEALGRISQDTNELLALVDELDQFLPDLQWTGMKIHHRLTENIDLMAELTTSCRQGKINIPALRKFLRTDLLVDYNTEQTEIESITVENPSLVKILFTHPIIDPDTRAYNIYAFKTYYNSTGDEKVLTYKGPTTLIHNHRINCTRAVESGEGPIYEKCETPGYEDPSLKTYELEPVPLVPLKPQILKTSSTSLIYCLYHDITIDTEETACIPDVVELPKLLPFKTQGLQHQVNTIVLNGTREVIQSRVRDFNETFHEDARHNTLGYINSIKELNKRLAEASRYNLKSWVESLLADPNNTLILGGILIIGFIMVSFRCFTCTERMTGVTVVTTAPAAPHYQEIHPTHGFKLGHQNRRNEETEISSGRIYEEIEICPVHAHGVEGGCWSPTPCAGPELD